MVKSRGVSLEGVGYVIIPVYRIGVICCESLIVNEIVLGRF